MVTPVSVCVGPGGGELLGQNQGCTVFIPRQQIALGRNSKASSQHVVGWIKSSRLLGLALKLGFGDHCSRYIGHSILS